MGIQIHGLRSLQRVGLSLLTGVLLAHDTALADLYRCTDARGGVRYTDDPHNCQGQAARHETQRDIQNSGAPSVAPASPRPRGARRSASPGFSDQAAAATWQQKKHAAQAELREIESQIPRWERLQTNCNRGADTWYTDEAGTKHTVTCSQIAAARSQAESEQTRLRFYLSEGLEEECRRAGCLPGWIR